VPAGIQARQLVHFYKAGPEYGRGVAKIPGLDVEKYVSWTKLSLKEFTEKPPGKVCALIHYRIRAVSKDTVLTYRPWGKKVRKEDRIGRHVYLRVAFSDQWGLRVVLLIYRRLHG
jgi:hypothetical protein